LFFLLVNSSFGRPSTFINESWISSPLGKDLSLSQRRIESDDTPIFSAKVSCDQSSAIRLALIRCPSVASCFSSGCGGSSPMLRPLVVEKRPRHSTKYTRSQQRFLSLFFPP